jgi:hypothetical protein
VSQELVAACSYLGLRISSLKSLSGDPSGLGKEKEEQSLSVLPSELPLLTSET